MEAAMKTGGATGEERGGTFDFGGVEPTRLAPAEMHEMLRKVPMFVELPEEKLTCFDEATVYHLPAGTVMLNPGDSMRQFWVLVTGQLRAYKILHDGSRALIRAFVSPETFGEVPLLAGTKMKAEVTITEDATLICLDEEGFWHLMITCPTVRTSILGNMARRLEEFQSENLQREKLIGLGTLAAGLMHELNNPGAAARRAAMQLRENMMRLQTLSLRFCRVQLNPEQVECIAELQERALGYHKPLAMSTLEQSDAEESLANWLEEHEVENAWRLAPTLVSIGMSSAEIECAQHVFNATLLSDSLNWLESLVSSIQMVGTVEESIGRVSDLVQAVKKYSYEGQGHQQSVDVHDSIQSTLVILGHKFRSKQIEVVKVFAPDVPAICTRASGLNQVWTNLLDNAIDAVPEKGRITIKTWLEGSDVFVSVADNGAGIPMECSTRVFEPFFTTKPVGVGTGLGLGIVHRIVVEEYGGEVRFDSKPGETVFIVRLPIGQLVCDIGSKAVAAK